MEKILVYALFTDYHKIGTCMLPTHLWLMRQTSTAHAALMNGIK